MDELSKPKFGAIVKVASENFAIVSSSALIFGVMTSALFTAGYLSVFNSGLIWLVDYADLIKVGIIVSVFFIGILYLYDAVIWGLLRNFYNNTDKKTKIINILFVVIPVIVAFIVNIYYSWNITSKLNQNISIATAFGFAVVCLFKIERIKEYGFQDLSDIASTIGMFALLMTSCGVVYGYHIKNSQNLKQVIFLDDRIINDAAIILMTDKFTVFSQADEAVTVFPSSRVREIMSKPSG